MFFQLYCASFQNFTKLELADLKLCLVVNYNYVFVFENRFNFRFLWTTHLTGFLQLSVL